MSPVSSASTARQTHPRTRQWHPNNHRSPVVEWAWDAVVGKAWDKAVVAAVVGAVVAAVVAAAVAGVVAAVVAAVVWVEAWARAGQRAWGLIFPRGLPRYHNLGLKISARKRS